MRILPRLHRSLLSIVAVSALGAAACGSSTANAPAPALANTAEPAAAAEPAPAAPAAAHGTSGMAGLDWGASKETVAASNSRATPNKDGELWAMGMVDGMNALTTYKFDAKGLSQIDVEWTEGLISMDECAKVWKKVRAEYDGRFGASQADNLAAYWKTATASITLTCSPNDSNAGVLAVTYAPLGSD